MTRTFTSALLIGAALFAISCGGQAEPSRDGESCTNTPNQFTCSTDLGSILECDDSNIWRTYASCDDSCGYTDMDACCTIDGASTCPAQADAE